MDERFQVEFGDDEEGAPVSLVNEDAFATPAGVLEKINEGPVTAGEAFSLADQAAGGFGGAETLQDFRTGQEAGSPEIGS